MNNYYFIKGSSKDDSVVYSGTWVFNGHAKDIYQAVKANLDEIIGSDCIVDQISFLGKYDN